MHETTTLLVEVGALLLLLGLLGRLSRRFGVSPIPLYLLAGLAFGHGGLLPLNARGLCAQVTSTYLSVMTGNNRFAVFTYKGGFVPSSDIVAGRQVSGNYKVLDNGLLQLTGVHVIGSSSGITVTGAQIPAVNTSSGPPVPTSSGVLNVNVKPLNLGQ